MPAPTHPLFKMTCSDSSPKKPKNIGIFHVIEKLEALKRDIDWLIISMNQIYIGTDRESRIAFFLETKRKDKNEIIKKNGGIYQYVQKYPIICSDWIKELKKDYDVKINKLDFLKILENE